MNFQRGILFQAVRQFKRQPIAENPDTDAAGLEEALDAAYKKGSQIVEEAWDRIRQMTTRANAAGAVAALALYGSQAFSDEVPRMTVFWVIVIFIAGLVFLLFRNLLAMLNAIFERQMHVERAGDFDPKAPCPIIMNAARLCDWLSVGFLAWGAAQGAYVLYSLALPRTC